MNIQVEIQVNVYSGGTDCLECTVKKNTPLCDYFRNEAPVPCSNLNMHSMVIRNKK